ncbi:MAG: hypothetical protein QOH39_190 [Verrucomicrobiota bacterium]|jgi:hypothetical protein
MVEKILHNSSRTVRAGSFACPHVADDEHSMMKQFSRSVAALLAASFLCSCGSTHVIMVGEARPATAPSEVRVYYTPPRNYQRIALIKSSSGASWAFTDREQVDEAIAKIKKEAARLGANGILLEAVGTSSSGNLGIGIGGFGVGGGRHSFYAAGGSGSFYGPILHKTANATAIYVR